MVVHAEFKVPKPKAKQTAQMKTVIFKDDEVQLSKSIFIKKNAENDFEIIDVCYFTRIEILTVEELF